MIPIYILTRGRVSKQTTWESIGVHAQNSEHTVLVCPTEEVSRHKHFGRRALDRGDIKGAPNVRQWILEHAKEKDYDKIIVLDDDLIFGRRAHPDLPSLRKTTKSEMHELWDRMEGLLDGFIHVGVSPRQMNDKHFPHVFKRCMRQNALHGLRPKDILKTGLKYNDVDLMEDYHMTLGLFGKGHSNAVITDWTWDQRGASGAPGGCSLYRDATLQESASKKLESMYPDFVKSLQKETKTGWEGMKTRWDVRVQWRKAAKQGGCEYGI